MGMGKSNGGASSGSRQNGNGTSKSGGNGNGNSNNGGRGSGRSGGGGNGGSRPTVVFRIGSYKLSCWRNSGKHGDFFTCKLRRIYMGENQQIQDTDGLNHTELLQASELLRVSYQELMQHTGKMKAEWLETEPENDGNDNGNQGEEQGGEDVPF